MTPPKGFCVHCGQPVLSNERAAYQVTGIEVERDQGGQNHVRNRQRVDGRIWHARYHGDCVDIYLSGAEQLTLA